ncbi:MAG TPA: hypothetical protein VFE38_01665 [Edaphobacter sp.]|nr:hypothetical protein [Edaphobacter sp.]
MRKQYGLSNQVRSVARERYVEAARRSGKSEFSIRVRDMLDALVPLGFPGGNTPQICNALRSQKFADENHLAIVGVDGPPSKMSTTVVVKYRFLPESKGTMGGRNHEGIVSTSEDAKARAKRLTEGLRGLLREELAEYGGGEEFLKWVRSEENAA